MTQYTIQQGDTFDAIAKNLHIALQDLLAANPGVDPTKLQIGQVINVPDGNNSGSGSGGAQTGSSVGGGYVQYAGPASNFPDPAFWADFDTLVNQNRPLMKLKDSDDEVGLVISSVNTVSQESGVDARVILCIIMQESGGNVRVPTTDNGVRNPGLMQSHDGAEFNPNDPQGSILQMVRDGTTGTAKGDGLKQLYAKYGNWYEAFRGYNSGSVDKNDLNNPLGATEHYVRNVANRLMGHIWNGM